MVDDFLPVPKDSAHTTRCTPDKYNRLYRESVTNSDQFWQREGKRLDWIKPYTVTQNTDFTGDVSIKWFEDGTLNACYNCVDRHLPEKADKTAILFEGDEPGSGEAISYSKLYEQVCQFANWLTSEGVTKGDRVTIYMPMIPQAVYAMLACARIGAIHSVVFGGFSPEALAGRLMDCQSRFIITANEGIRGGKSIPLKKNVDKAITVAGNIDRVFVIKRTESPTDMMMNRDIWHHEGIKNQPKTCPAVAMAAEDPLFILYTSGSTGKPKGVLHTTGGYMVWASMTHDYVFDHRAEDIYWCTADVGWITGHSYIVYGPLANGATTLVFEGVPTYPDVDRFWQIVEKYRVTSFYTAPTALRALMRFGVDPIKRWDCSSLRLLGTVGEPINPDVWLWYHREVGNSVCPVVDTWWQTETGGIMITPLPGATALKPGSATLPFFGIAPTLMDAAGHIVEGPGSGNLVIGNSWPGQMRTIYGDHQRFKEIYFSAYPGFYFTGDGCRRDDDGYYWITGRVDDVINVSGHRLGTAEIESALVTHPDVSEAAVVGYLHDIKGQGIYAYVTLKQGARESEQLKQDLISTVRQQIGPIASPDLIHFTQGLPKTRSGKIMRRILRKIAENDFDTLGDTSTLAEPDVITYLICDRQNRS